MIHVDSYETTVGKFVKLDSIKHSIKKYIIEQELEGDDNLSIGNGKKPYLDYIPLDKIYPLYIQGDSHTEDDIKLFSHPISIFNYRNYNWVAVDLRLFLVKKKKDEILPLEERIKNTTEYGFNKSRAILNCLWLSQERSSLKQSLSFSTIVYTSWLSEIISKAFVLDPGERETIALIANYFYQSLFIDEDVKMTNSLKEKMVTYAFKTSYSKAKYIMEVFDQIEKLETIDDFLENVIKIVNNNRLDNLNLPVLLTLATNSWYGVNAKEILSVSLELPCSWMAIVYTALTEKSFKYSMISKLCDNLGKNNKATEFLNNYKSIVFDFNNINTNQRDL